MDDFLVLALVGGIGVAAFMGPLGVFVVWRRMAYFGDALAHSALLGVALGFLVGIDPSLGMIAICMTMGVSLVLLRRRRQLAEDTLLGILAHSSLALGLIAVSFLQTLRLDLMSYLFGDILAVSTSDIIWIYLGGGIALAVLCLLWRSLVAITVHEELARVEGVRVLETQLLFVLLIAAVIGLAMKVVGILLVTSLLIIPAATARRFAATPEQMAVIASLIGCLAMVLGLGGSLLWNLPSGPAVVAAAAALFVVSMVYPERHRRPGRAGASGTPN